MEWVLRSPQIHSLFASLGSPNGDGYHIKENCNAALESILHNILSEDKYLRTYRRNISFGQNVTKDIIPLLIHAKEDKTVELLVRILVNLTIPIECLLSVDVISRTDFGRHTIFEINNLLASIKSAFTDHRTTKVIFEFLKKNLDGDQQKSTQLSVEQCENISNSLLLLRNVLHIPEGLCAGNATHNNGAAASGAHAVQNQILWNIFSQSFDKILIKLMSIPEASNWGVTMVQLIALLYKDQHVVTLHKLLNLWLETSLSESSEDNESNTSPPDRGDDSSPMLTSDPTSDSSDTGGSRKSNDEQNSSNENSAWNGNTENTTTGEIEHQFQPPPPADKLLLSKRSPAKTTPAAKETIKTDNQEQEAQPKAAINMQTEQVTSPTTVKKTVISENSDCGYGTQIENQESISTSSNEDDLPAQKPVHQKPHNPKQRANTKVRTGQQLQDRKRKKIVKRGKANIINVQGLSHKTPTDEDISNILKEFTVDFLLKGYNSLVQTLHGQILTNVALEIDTSHFFWLVTYFLKFATQIELDLEHVSSVLSYDIISYLTAEGVNLCEQFDLAIKLGNDLKPSIRRLHLVVTAIREFVQAIEVYKKIGHVCDDDQEQLLVLQVKVCETEELRSLLVLLLRHYNPKYHTKQYLQDLIVTNHILLLFVDSVMKLPHYNGSTNMTDHIKQFATPEVMYQYGLLLEDYSGNGEFVNDCIFTLMHHVGGELGCLITLFQPSILKTFTSIWKDEFEICDDWSDLIEYVINTFIKKPHTLQRPTNVFMETESFEDDNGQPLRTEVKTETNDTEAKKKDNSPTNSSGSKSKKERWTDDELSSLNWNYMQCSTLPDIIGGIIKLFKEDDITKSRESIIRELYKQRLINKDDLENVSKVVEKSSKPTSHAAEETRNDEILKLCRQLILDGKSKFLDWLQKVLLEACYVKICLAKRAAEIVKEAEQNKETKVLRFEFFKKKANEFPVMSPVTYHALVYNQSIPLVTWNCEQGAICKDLKFLRLLHKLGFHMPIDTGKMFIRIPHFWTADFLYEISGKVANIDTTKLKFSTMDISETSLSSSIHEGYAFPQDKSIDMLPTPENYYQILKQKHLATMVKFTPMPGSSFTCEGGEHGNTNWLEVVQKAQDCKFSLNLHSGMDELNEEDVVMQDNSLAPEQAAGAGLSPSKRRDTFDETLPEDYNNSLCETASVASDLTRMYVSDEEDKSEVLIIPTMEEVHLPDENASADSDTVAEKRIRRQ